MQAASTQAAEGVHDREKKEAEWRQYVEQIQTASRLEREEL